MTRHTPFRIEIGLKPSLADARGEAAVRAIRQHLGLPVDQVRTRDIYIFVADLSAKQLEQIRGELTDPVIQRSGIPRLEPEAPFDQLIVVGFKPGVTDNVGRTARTILGDILGRRMAEDESVHTSIGYELRGAGLTGAQAERIARELLANTLVESVEVVDWAAWQAGEPKIAAPKVDPADAITVKRYDLSGTEDQLMHISREGILSLSLAEMRAIRDHFNEQGDSPERRAAGLDHRPTDVELETLAQTWSEHCKHKIFDADVQYAGPDGRPERIQSLFKTYIKGTTDQVARRIDWLVSVFHDNAGVIAFNERLDLVYKVETHNSPSALEPYGGAMTGIVGVNRDPLGTGLGAELLINVWGYCFASPETPAEQVPPGALHPRRVREGVHKGVIDGGNQSGIPYGAGWEFYDARYMAKPLVYCGTVGTLPKHLPDGRAASQKAARPGDLVVMVGGRIGKDGIHGATFSSQELHIESPVQAVQIGDPITQKKMSDMLLEARDRGLFSAITDNGAGGLSSSVGEMAETPGGAEVDLAQAPLKYAGLQPWEIWLSEAQERMTLAVPAEKIDELSALAKRRDVELTVLGTFNDSGFLTLRYGPQVVGRLELRFMHEGYPRLELGARWHIPHFPQPALPAAGRDLNGDLRGMLERLNIASKAGKCRQYDHEVKGRTIVKPLVGRNRDVPADATVFLADYTSREGIVLATGFNAHYSDLDTYWMMASAVDMAVRRILAAGGRPDFIAGLDNFCWPDPVLSESTPDGTYKMAQLVRACRALKDVCVAYGVPLISGKDSMKNDSTRGGRKISIPPSVLFSAIGKIDHVERAITLEAKAAGDYVYVVGWTRPEMGGSEYAHYLSDRAGEPEDHRSIGGTPPRLDPGRARKLYEAVAGATAGKGVRSLHAPTLGGLGVGLAMVAFGGELGLEIDLGELPTQAEGSTAMSEAQMLFSESNARFIATVAPDRAEAFEIALQGHPFGRIGRVTETRRLFVRGQDGNPVISAELDELKQAWTSTFADL